MNNDKSNVNHLADISEKLDTVVGFMMVRGIENDAGAVVERLRIAGFNARVIARVSGLTENAVAIRLTRAKAKKKPAEKPEA